jgi:hypothetical protein
MAGGRDVNEKCCAKVFEGWKSLARDLIFGGGGQIEERFLASFGMTAQKKEKKGRSGAAPLQRLNCD